MTRHATHAVLLMSVGVLLSGCFSYVPSSVEVAPIGQDVRLLVSRAGARELSQVPGIDEEVPTLRGTILEREGESLLLRVPVGHRQDGFHRVSLDQAIQVPVAAILRLERRQLDVAKTSGLVGAALVGSAFVIFSIMDALAGDDGSGDPAQPEEALIPLRLYSLPFGR